MTSNTYRPPACTYLPILTILRLRLAAWPPVDQDTVLQAQSTPPIQHLDSGHTWQRDPPHSCPERAEVSPHVCTPGNEQHGYGCGEEANHPIGVARSITQVRAEQMLLP